MKKQKKSRFWTFWLSFIPGAAEMYMGFMKMGLSLMTLFTVVAFVSVVLNMGPLMFIDVIAWFYSFFHARNLASLTPEEMQQTEDTYLLNFTQFSTDSIQNVLINQKVIAYVLLVFGIYVVWNSGFHAIMSLVPLEIYYMVARMQDYITRLVLGVVIIYVGIRLIRGKQKELFDQEKEASGEDKYLLEEERNNGGEEKKDA